MYSVKKLFTLTKLKLVSKLTGNLNPPYRAASIYRFIDDEAGVVCYIIEGEESDGLGISCLPLSETNLAQ